MIKLETKPLFGKKKHLAEEQWDLYWVLNNLEMGSIWADPRILNSYDYENVAKLLPPDFRRKKAMEFFKTAQKELNKVM
jgi:hypothetical protein